MDEKGEWQRLNVSDVLAAGMHPADMLEKLRIVSKCYANHLVAQRKVLFTEGGEGNLPTAYVTGKTLPEVWENTILTLLAIGENVHTHYDPTDKQGEFTSFRSMDASVTMHIEDVFGEPRFHRNYLGGWKGFGDYKAEIEGVKNHWMLTPKQVNEKIRQGKFDEIKSDHRWNYTYNQRIFAFPFIGINGEDKTANQLEAVVQKLVEDPLSRSAQATTWDPRWDNNLREMGVKWDDYHSPCLQSLWFRMIPTKEGFTLNLNTRWRSRDHLKAVPQNIYAITEIYFAQVRAELEKRLGKPVKFGRYVDTSDSLHLYGHYFDPRKQGKDAEAYLQSLFNIFAKQPFEERVILPGTPMHELMTEEIEEEYKFRKANPDAGFNA